MTVITSLLVVSLQVPAGAQTIRRPLGWHDMRAVTSHAEIVQRVTVWLDPDRKRLVKGRLTEKTGVGIALGKREKQRAPCFDPRSGSHTVGPVPVKSNRLQGHRHRGTILAAIAVLPVWFFTYTVGLAAGGGIPDDGLYTDCHAWRGLLPATPVTYFVFGAAWIADRATCAILVGLDHGKQQGLWVLNLQ